jgi:hypothetical protein
MDDENIPIRRPERLLVYPFIEIIPFEEDYEYQTDEVEDTQW